MPACATAKTITETTPAYNLILPVPDTDFREFLAEVDKLAECSPEIITSIESDLSTNAREKKRVRLADRTFVDKHSGTLPPLAV